VDAAETFTATSAFGVLGIIADLGDIGIGIALTALEEKGFSRMLAEPNLVALSGNQASFLAGQDVPIPTVDEDGQTDVEFKEIGVSLNFTPTVLDDDLINLELSVEVSSIDTTTPGIPISATQGNVIPLFNVRRATTAIELRDGQSFAIAGLLEDSFADSVSQFPWLGDIPVLGTLFRSMDFSRGETELVIIVTAHLVVPVSAEELSVPHDNVRIPNEFELFLLGQTDGAGAPGMVQSASFDGDFGYVVE
jgi:pilus assembly protein CpaC